MLSKEDTKRVKGVAILLMLAHHLYGFESRIPFDHPIKSGLSLSGMDLFAFLGDFGELCLALYMFLGGYGLYAASHTGEGKPLTPLSRRVVGLFRAYWKVFLIFIPLGFLFFSGQIQYCEQKDICSKFASFSWIDFIGHFIGWYSFYNAEWWFFKSYLIALFQGYLFYKVFEKNKNIYLELVAVILWYILCCSVFPGLGEAEGLQFLYENSFYTTFLMLDECAVSLFVGMVFAKYGIFDVWRELYAGVKGWGRVILSAAVMALVAYVRVLILPDAWDILLAPVFILACVELAGQLRFLRRPLLFLGRNSTNMWLIHSFYCYYFYGFVRLVYGSGNGWIDYLTLLGLALGSGLLVDLFWRGMGRIYGKICASFKNLIMI